MTVKGSPKFGPSKEMTPRQKQRRKRQRKELQMREDNVTVKNAWEEVLKAQEKYEMILTLAMEGTK